MSRDRLRKLSRARPSDVIEVAAAAAATARVEWGLRRRSLPVTASGLGLALFAGDSGAIEPTSSTDPLALPDWAWRRARIARIVLRRSPFGDTCLRRALVIGNRLASLEPELVIGVRSGATPSAVDAHAWLRIRGVELDPLANEYLAFGAP